MDNFTGNDKVTVGGKRASDDSSSDTFMSQWRLGSGDVEASQKGCRSMRRYVVIGGGIAGVSCAQELQRLLYACDSSDEESLRETTESIDIVVISLTDHLTEV